MESEKVKEIKKALEENANYEYYNKLGYIDGYTCKTVAYADILTYINELESENETLKFNIQETEKASFNINQMNGNLVIENQQLKDRIAELEKDKEKWQRKAVNYYQRAKSYGIECIIDNDIDEILKEFIK